MVETWPTVYLKLYVQKKQLSIFSSWFVYFHLSMVWCNWLICDFLVINLVIDCSANAAVTIQWRPELNWGQKLDLSKAHLGSCPPSSISMEHDMLLFSVWLHDCGFKRLVTCLFCICVTSRVFQTSRSFEMYSCINFSQVQQPGFLKICLQCYHEEKLV